MDTRTAPLAHDPPAAPRPGGRRLGSIELQQVLVTRGHALSWQAWDHGLGRPVVVEEYFPAALAQRDAQGHVQPAGGRAGELFEQGRQGFVEAWRALAQIDHPALVRVLLLLDAHGTAYAVTAAQPGELLAEQPECLPLAGPALEAMLRDLLGALQACHAAGRLHGDLHPGSVRWHEGGGALLVAPCAPGPLPEGAAGERAIAGDLDALARLARYALTGIALPAPSAALPSLPLAIERLGVEALAPRLSPGLAGLLTGAPGADAPRWRAALAGAPPAAPAARASAPPPRRQDAVPPLPSAAPEPAPSEAIDPDVQRVLASFGAPGERPATRTRPYVAEDESGLRRWPLWLGLMLVAGALGLGLWQMDRRPPEGVRLAAEPVRPATAPSVPPVATPPVPAPPPAPEAAAASALPPLAAVAPTLPSAPAVPVTPAPPAEPAAAPTPPTPRVIEPPRVRPTLPPATPASRPPPRGATTPPIEHPRQACGGRTQFALYRCMERVCTAGRWYAHPECVRFRVTDSVD